MRDSGPNANKELSAQRCYNYCCDLKMAEIPHRKFYAGLTNYEVLFPHAELR